MSTSWSFVASGKITLLLWEKVKERPITTISICCDKKIDAAEFNALLRAYDVAKFPEGKTLIGYSPGFPFEVKRRIIAVPRDSTTSGRIKLECSFQIFEYETCGLQVKSSIEVLSAPIGLHARAICLARPKLYQLVQLPRVMRICRASLGHHIPAKNSAPSTDSIPIAHQGG